ncbi:MAG: hypothetical protein ACRDSL_04385 [Pseudonocardiaceae bacterium]
MATLAEQQQTIVRDLLRLLVALFPSLDPQRITDTWPGLLLALVNEVQAAHTAAGQAAVGVYLDARAQAGTNVAPFRPSLATLDAQGLQRLRASLTITGPVALMRALRRGQTPGMARKLALVQLQGTATRHALAGARETTLRAVAEDPVALGWARIPRPDACPFCLLLSTRGGVYRSAEAARLTTGRSSRGAGHTYHDHCRCEVVGIFTEDWTPPEHVAHAEALYREVTAGKSGAAARKAFADAVAAERSAEREPPGPEPVPVDLDAVQRRQDPASPEPEPAAPTPPAGLDDDQPAGGRRLSCGSGGTATGGSRSPSGRRSCSATSRRLAVPKPSGETSSRDPGGPHGAGVPGWSRGRPGAPAVGRQPAQRWR